MNKIFLACYRGRGDKLAHRLCDGITRFFTRGKYSHTEIAIVVRSPLTWWQIKMIWSLNAQRTQATAQVIPRYGHAVTCLSTPKGLASSVSLVR